MHPQSNPDTIIAIIGGAAIYGAVLLLLGVQGKGISFFQGLLQKNASAVSPNGGKAE